LIYAGVPLLLISISFSKQFIAFPLQIASSAFSIPSTKSLAMPETMIAAAALSRTISF
jgi:hypothetical protein